MKHYIFHQLNVNERGFSLIELMAVMVVSAIFSGLIIFFGFNYWHFAILRQADLTTYVERLNTGDYLREAIGSSSGLIIQNSIPDNNTLNPDPAFASHLYWQPIHAVPGNKSVGVGSTKPLIYFKRYSVNNTGAFVMNGTQPYEDEYVLYIDGTTKQLLVRSLANPNATNNRLKTSCPPAIASVSCPADKMLLSDLGSVDLRYFSRSGNLIDYSSITDPVTGEYIGPDFPVVEVAEFTVNVSKQAVFQKSITTSSSTIIRIALRNA